MMGGADRILARGRQLHDAGQYREAVEILDKLVYAEPDNPAARELLAEGQARFDGNRAPGR